MPSRRRDDPETTCHDLSAQVGASERMARVARAALARYPAVAADLTPADVLLEPVTISENATFRVGAGGQWRILRVHRLGYHTPTQIASELAWLDAVRDEAGVRTPRVEPAADGERVVQVADPGGGPDRSVVLFELLPGAEPAPEALVPLAALLGRITARLHAHARAWRPPAWFDRFRWDADAAFGPAPRWGRWQDGPGVGPAERQLLARTEAVVSRRLSGYGTGADRFGLVHADLRAANLLVEPAAVDPGSGISVIDFDDCGFSWYLYDLAAALSFVEDRPDLPDAIEAWLDGYRAVEPVPAEDAAEVDTLVMLRRMSLLAWLGTHHRVPTATELSDTFAARTCALAETYLTRHG